MTCPSILAIPFTCTAGSSNHPMLQFVLRGDGPETERSAICGKVPFKIGRGNAADFQLSAPGVWDIHAEVVSDPSGKLLLKPAGDAIVLVNGERSEGRLLMPGDELQLGGARLLVALSPVSQKRLSRQEALVWLIFTAVILGEIICFVYAR
jgi:hypothetical protein